MPIFLFLLIAICGFLWADEGKPPNGDEALRVQIFLDQKCFGPGFLDGKPGNFTSRAAYSYNRFQGRSPGNWAPLVVEALEGVQTLHAIATVPSLATDFVNPRLPTEKSLQAKDNNPKYSNFFSKVKSFWETSSN